MKAVVTRPIDNLGRIVLPKEMRDRHGLKVGMSLDIVMDDAGNIILSKSNQFCRLCGKDGKGKVVNNVFICITCVEQIANTN